MIDLPIVDTHVHFADPESLEYPWIEEGSSLDRAFLPADFKKANGDLNIERIVFLQCECLHSQGADEARWVAQLSEEDPRIQGTVAFAPLEKGDAAQEELDVLSDIPLVKGIRRLIQPEGIDFCIQPEFVRGVQVLEKYDLSFDLCIHNPQFENTIELVRQCPNIRFILDHVAKPDIANHVMEPWAMQLKALSEMDNVWCKVSGMVTEADHTDWTLEDLKPYIDQVISSFGFERVIYGGDWFVSTLACEYPQWVEALAWALEGCSEGELRALFSENGKAFYRLSE